MLLYEYPACLCDVMWVGRRASIEFLKGNSEMAKVIETEVREIMAKKLSAGGVTSSDEVYDEDEGEGEVTAPGDEDDFDSHQS